ncbi:MAG: peroxiredoxin [Candidatus Zixiibacteriota bacterium]
MSDNTKLDIGAKAPLFSLPNQDGTKVSLKDHAGRWLVLYFYPKDDTPGCTTEACDFTSGLIGFEKLEASVLGVSPDSPASHREFIAKYKLGFPLLSDESKEVLAQYGAWSKKNMYGKETVGVIRSTFLIDPEGKIAHTWYGVKVEGHADKVREKLAELAG